MKKLIVLVWFGALALAPALAAEGTPIDERRPLDANGQVTVHNLSGRIEVRAWKKNEVAITGTLGRGSEELSISGGADELHIEVELPEDADDVEASDLYLQVPEGAHVELESVSADLKVSGTRGPVRLTSVSGAVDVDGMMRDVRAETVSGDIAVRAPAAETRLQSVSGEIRAREVRGAMRAEAVSGDVSVSGGGFAELELEAVSGDVELDVASLADDADVRIDSVSGDVTVTVPKALNTRLRLSTYSGELASDFGKPQGRRATTISATLGAGKGQLRVETHSGDIALKAR